MIDSKQIKAARALLGWTQADLAQTSGLSLAAIANLERGASKPRQETMLLLQQTCEMHGVAFLEPTGVQLVADRFQIKVWSGHESILRLWQDIMRDFSDQKGGDILFSGVNERHWIDRYRKELPEYLGKMKGLGAKYRLLLCDGDNFVLGNPDQYRQIHKLLFAQIPYCIYRNKMAIIIWKQPQKVTLIENASVADTFRSQFEANWAQAKTLVKPEVLDILPLMNSRRRDRRE